MKVTYFLSFLILMTGSSYGQQQGYGNAPSDVTSSANACVMILTKMKEREALAKEQGKTFKQEDKELQCVAFEYTAKMNNESLNSPRESTATLDKKITCEMKAGYTLDYTACTNTIRTYDALAVLEQGMFQSQQMDMNATQQTIQANTNAQIAKDGDVTSAALEAQKNQTLKAKQLNEQQSASYAAATMALVAAINAWPASDSDAAILRMCSGMKSQNDSAECFKQVKLAKDTQKNTVFANTNAKNAFKGAAIQFAVKGGKALIEAIRLGLQADQIQQVKDAAAATNDNNSQFSPCLTDSTLPGCAEINPGTRVGGANYGGGDFGASDTNSNNFNMGNDGDSTFGDIGAATNIKDKPNASSVNSPFASVAKQANSILDPAAAASMSPGGNSSGGGGGGGGMGGGSASLGNDLKGLDPNENAEKDIKASEVSGNYSQGGGAGFKGIKASADDNFNPYGNLLDAKSQNGGVVEDRSIASTDGKPFTSGLFERLSSRYDQAVKSKKIEPKYDE